MDFRNKMKKRELRERLFADGSAAYERATGRIGFYACPICLREFSSLSGLTLEHSPQKSIGGREIALTCETPCNSNPNSKIDAVVAGECALADFLFSRMTQARRVRVRFGVNVIGADLIRTSDGQQFTIPRKSNALAFKTLMIEKPKDLVIEFKWGSDSRLASLGLLKAAYVGSFAKFGYQYIMQPSLELVRAQIQRPAEILIHPIRGWRQGDHLKDRIRVVNTPLKHIVVKIGESRILLPGINESSNTFWNWHRDVIAKGIPFESGSCWTLSWPTALEMTLDCENAGQIPARPDSLSYLGGVCPRILN